MNISIDKDLLEQLVQTNIAYNSVMSRLLESIRDDDEWVGTGKARTLTGISTERIRYLARSGRIQSRKIGPKLIEVRLRDLKNFTE